MILQNCDELFGYMQNYKSCESTIELFHTPVGCYLKMNTGLGGRDRPQATCISGTFYTESPVLLKL